MRPVSCFLFRDGSGTKTIVEALSLLVLHLQVSFRAALHARTCLSSDLVGLAGLMG